MKVEKGDKVTVSYEGKLDDGTVFDATAKHGKPLEFIAGEKQIIPGFEKALEGMSVGEEKKVSIAPQDAYGERNDAYVKDFPKKQFPEGEIKPGMMIGITMPNGQQMPAVITAVKDDTVTLDLNHPLAGKTLHFTFKLDKVEKAKAK